MSVFHPFPLPGRGVSSFLPASRLKWSEHVSEKPHYIYLEHHVCPACGAGPWFFVVSREEHMNVIDWLLQCAGCKSKFNATEIKAMATSTLQNGNFEDGFSKRGAGEVVIANGWEYWAHNSTYWNGEIKRPEWKQETRSTGRGRVNSGMSAQKQFTTFALQRAGLTQRLTVTPGKWYKFAIWCYVWASKEDNADVSKGGRLHCRVGANPWGEWPTHYATVWGKEVEEHQYDQWTKIDVVFQAWKSEVNVFTEALAEYAVKHNDSYWDDATFEEIEFGTQPPPDPQPQPDPVAGECGFVNRWGEVLDNQAEILQELARVPKHGDIVTL